MTPTFSIDTHVRVRSLSRVVEGDEVVLGLPTTGTFLTIPVEGLEILDDLAAGATVGEAGEAFAARHGETPDLADFLGALAAKGFLKPLPSNGDGSALAPQETPDETPSETPRREHFAGIPRPLAAALFSRPALVFYLVLIGLAIAAVLRYPEISPTRSSLVFTEGMSLSVSLLTVALLATLFVHELAHLIAARAAGVASRLGIGNRLWFLVAETDMTLLWTLPRQERILPILAGPLADATMASVLVLYAGATSALGHPPPPVVGQMLAALAFLIVLRLVWQLFLFVRTDFYYLVANLCGCRNLMGDTESLLRDRVSRWRGRSGDPAWQNVPPAEKRIVRGYAVLWIAGRIVAVAVLVCVHIPVLLAYLRRSWSILAAGPAGHPINFFDGLVTFVLTLGVSSAGFVLWARSSLRKGVSPHVRSSPPLSDHRA